VLVVGLIGFAFAFVGSMPVAGPIAAIVLARGLVGRARSGALVGVGCALAESGYAFLALWGYSNWLARHAWMLPASRVIAALLLLGLGVALARYRGAAAQSDRPEGSDTALASVGLGAGIAALNPTLLATWTGATTALHATGLVVLEARHAPVFALGAFLGTSAWFTVFSVALHRLRGRFEEAALARIVRGTGWVVGAVGGLFAVRVAWQLATGSAD
jgi:threonine/homoserine/homoserine lactone efflux protein